MTYKVIIVEDDPMVASINNQYVQKNKRLEVVGIFPNGQQALEFLKSNPVDLIILDMYMPMMDGQEFLINLRSRGIQTDVIMVTAANDVRHITTLLSYGIFDYLVKPFEFNRFNEALEKFLKKKVVFERQGNLSQRELDNLLNRADTDEMDLLPSKGLQSKTLESIRNYLRQHPGEGLSSEQIAAKVGLSRVTIRRYMNYLIEIKEVSNNIDYNTGGRPSIIYHYTP